MSVKVTALAKRIRIVMAVALATTATPALAQDVVIHAGRLFDGVSKTQREKMSILVRGDRIVEVRPGFVTPDDSGATTTKSAKQSLDKPKAGCDTDGVGCG